MRKYRKNSVFLFSPHAVTTDHLFRISLQNVPCESIISCFFLPFIFLFLTNDLSQKKVIYSYKLRRSISRISQTTWNEQKTTLALGKKTSCELVEALPYSASQESQGDNTSRHLGDMNSVIQFFFLATGLEYYIMVLCIYLILISINRQCLLQSVTKPLNQFNGRAS